MTQTRAPQTPVLQVDGLSFAYSEQSIFNNWSARVPPGLTLLKGGDGSGKTTLLRLLSGQVQVNAGRLQVGQICLDEDPLAYRRQVYWTDPWTQAFDQMSAAAYFDLVKAQQPDFNSALLGDLVDGLNVGPHLQKPLYMLSTGSKRKVWLAASFSAGAAVTLLDEPFAALDKASIGFLLELLEDAADHPTRAWILAHHEAPGQLPMAATIELAS